MREAINGAPVWLGARCQVPELQASPRQNGSVTGAESKEQDILKKGVMTATEAPKRRMRTCSWKLPLLNAMNTSYGTLLAFATLPSLTFRFRPLERLRRFSHTVNRPLEWN